MATKEEKIYGNGHENKSTTVSMHHELAKKNDGHERTKQKKFQLQLKKDGKKVHFVETDLQRHLCDIVDVWRLKTET